MDSDSIEKKIPFVAIAGGTACGKTTICKKLIENLEGVNVCVISTDSFYNSLENLDIESKKNYNFDHPDAFDWALMESKISDILSGNSTNVPIYDFVTYSRMDESTLVENVDVLVLEGILSLHRKEIRDMCDIKVYIDADSDIRLVRRIKRDMLERGRNLESVLRQYTKTVKPSFNEFCIPTKDYCDICLTNNDEQNMSLDIIKSYIKMKSINAKVEY